MGKRISHFIKWLRGDTEGVDQAFDQVIAAIRRNADMQRALRDELDAHRSALVATMRVLDDPSATDEDWRNLREHIKDVLDGSHR